MASAASASKNSWHAMFDKKSPESRVIEIVPFLYPMLTAVIPLSKLAKRFMKSASKAEEFRLLGNNKYVSENYVDALKIYTKSIAVAPVNGKEIALAYANRSAVLFKLRRFKSCLVDIGRSLENKYPDELKKKLIIRREECMKELRIEHFKEQGCFSNKEFDDNEIPGLCGELSEKAVDEDITDLNFDERFPLPAVNFKNEKISNASEKIKIHITEEMGVHLVATEHIEPGEVLLIEKPYASILSLKYKYSHCSVCFIRTESLIPCCTCSMVMFCGRHCREEAQNLYHRVECQILPFVKALKLQEAELLAVRIVLIATKQGKELQNLMEHPIYGKPFSKRCVDVNDKYISGSYFAVHNLENHYKKRSSKDCLCYGRRAAILLHTLKGSFFFDEIKRAESPNITEAEAFVGTLLLKYLFTQHVTGHEVAELIEEEVLPFGGTASRQIFIGRALCTLPGLMNHSCDSSSDNHWHKNRIVSRSIKPIAAGEQIFTYYGILYHSHSLRERREYLKRYHYNFFECHCIACEFDWPTYVNLPTENPQYLSDDSVDKNELKKYSNERRLSLHQIYLPILDEEFDFACEYLSLMHKCIKRPWKKYVEYQRRLQIMLSHIANHYTLDDTIIY